MSEDIVPVAVAGAGNMGMNHIRVFDELPSADLVEVVEPDPDRAATVTDSYDGITIRESAGELESARAVSIAVPNRYHRDVAITCIENGCDVLVEKPLAPTLEVAQAILNAANDHDSILQVGHIERFNPGVQALSEIIDGETVVSIDAQRLGPFSDHLVEENVVFDLMIHDLDVVVSLLGEQPGAVEAMGTRVHSDTYDHATALLGFSDETVASVTASHVTHGKIRELQVTTLDAFIRLEYQKQDIVIQRVGTEEVTPLMNQSGYRTETVTEQPFISNREPLKNELEHFIERVNDRESPLVDGEDGVRAVALAERVVDSLDKGCVSPDPDSSRHG